MSLYNNKGNNLPKRYKSSKYMYTSVQGAHSKANINGSERKSNTVIGDFNTTGSTITRSPDKILIRNSEFEKQYR